MGNLLGSPITEKDTHTGTTLDEQSLDSGGLSYGISSMQGWRVHMEDAHIVQPFLYAEKKKQQKQKKKEVVVVVPRSTAIGDCGVVGQSGSEGESDGAAAAIEISLSKEGNNVTAAVQSNTTSTSSSSSPPGSSSSSSKYLQIPLPNHSLFAVFDGHGGSFAAEYSSRNLLRVLSRQLTFVEYAEKWRDRECYLERFVGGLSSCNENNEEEEIDDDDDDNSGTAAKEDGGGGGGDDVDKQRLQELKQRGRESDATVKKIKERVRRHLGGGSNKSSSTSSRSSSEGNNPTNTTQQKKRSPPPPPQKTKEGWWKSTITSPTTPHPPNNNNKNNSIHHHLKDNLPTTPQNNTNAIQIATAAYDHNLMILLESSLRDAFCDLDKEIFEEVAKSIVGSSGSSGSGENDDDEEDRNMVYGIGYPFGGGGSGGGVGHLPKGSAGGGGDGEGDETSSSLVSSLATAANTHQPPPTPTDDEDSGTTAAIVLLTPRWIVCANAGDSRAVYSRSNHRVVALSYDHKPDDEEEERRINDAGGYVSAGRVEGDLAVSRGLGDFRFKEEEAVLSGAQGENRDGGGSNGGVGGSSSSSSNNNTAAAGKNSSMVKPGDQKVSPVPDIIVQNRNRAEDEFIIIACDGIWDVQTNQECVKMVADIFSEGEEDLGLIAEEILDLCLIKGSKDNMTAAVIKFPKQVVGQGGGGVMARREGRGAAEDADEHTDNVRAFNPYGVMMETNGDEQG